MTPEQEKIQIRADIEQIREEISTSQARADQKKIAKLERRLATKEARLKELDALPAASPAAVASSTAAASATAERPKVIKEESVSARPPANRSLVEDRFHAVMAAQQEAAPLPATKKNVAPVSRATPTSLPPTSTSTNYPAVTALKAPPLQPTIKKCRFRLHMHSSDMCGKDVVRLSDGIETDYCADHTKKCPQCRTTLIRINELKCRTCFRQERGERI